MTLRERILSVYRGEMPDVVPFMLDLSHWFYHKNHLPWDLSKSYTEPEEELIDYHKRMGVGFYLANLAAFYSVEYRGDVQVEVRKDYDGNTPRITWRYFTPIGSIERTRIWNDTTYAWGVKDWGVKTEHDLDVLAYAMAGRKFKPHWDVYQQWVDYVGDIGVVYMPLGYSAMGHILNSWMGIEATIYAAADWPDTMRKAVDAINNNTLDLVDMLARSPAEIIETGDNFSSDIQPPTFFNEWSRDYYVDAIARLHKAGKYVAVHIDGKLKGALSMIRDTGADCSDATTPPPMGDLSPRQCREEAGPDFILSGGVSPDLWLPGVPLEHFKKAVKEWLDTKSYSFRLIANAGDQVPPGAEEDRIKIMRDMVEEYGRFREQR